MPYLRFLPPRYDDGKCDFGGTWGGNRKGCVLVVGCDRLGRSSGRFLVSLEIFVGVTVFEKIAYIQNATRNMVQLCKSNFDGT